LRRFGIGGEEDLEAAVKQVLAAGAGRAIGANAPADIIRRFEDDRRAAGFQQLTRTAQTRQAGTYDYHVCVDHHESVSRWLD
jgi:hypothetical protein